MLSHPILNTSDGYRSPFNVTKPLKKDATTTRCSDVCYVQSIREVMLLLSTRVHAPPAWVLNSKFLSKNDYLWHDNFYRTHLMDFKNLVYEGRTFRRFDSSYAVSDDELLWLVDLGRVTPRARNAQWIYFGVTNHPDSCQRIFSTLRWAAALPEWNGPTETERPSAYILLLENTQYPIKGSDIALGIVSQTILLGARSIGLGGCHILSFNPKTLSESLHIPEQLKVRMVLALGKPIETVEIRNLPPSGDARYWREDNVHCVPKAPLRDIIIKL